MYCTAIETQHTAISVGSILNCKNSEGVAVLLNY